MHILHLTPYYRPAYAFGGVVRAVEGMASSLVERGHQVTVLTTDAADQQSRLVGARRENIDGVEIWRCPNFSPWLRGRFNLSTPRSMKRAAEALLPEVDVLHIHEFRTVENLLVTPVAQRLGKAILLSPHGTLNLETGRGRLKAAWDRILSPALAQRIDQVIALTEHESAEAESLWRSFGARESPTRFSVIPNAVRPKEFSQLPGADVFRARYGLADAPTVLFMGRLQARKGVDILIEAFLAAEVENARLLIVGPDEGMGPALRAISGGDPRIVFTGYLDGSERLAALAAGDVFALPATGEGQSIALLEAMAAGLPAVISPGCYMDEVDDYGAGFVAEASVEAFAAKLRELLRDGEKRREMGAEAWGFVAEKHSWESVTAALESVYLELIEASKS